MASLHGQVYTISENGFSIIMEHVIRLHLELTIQVSIIKSSMNYITDLW